MSAMVIYHSTEAAQTAMQFHMQAATELVLEHGALPSDETRRAIDEHLAVYNRAAQAFARLEARNRRATESLKASVRR